MGRLGKGELAKKNLTCVLRDRLHLINKIQEVLNLRYQIP